MGISIDGDTQKWKVYNGQIIYKWMSRGTHGYPYFRKPPYGRTWMSRFPFCQVSVGRPWVFSSSAKLAATASCEMCASPLLTWCLVTGHLGKMRKVPFKRLKSYSYGLVHDESIIIAIFTGEWLLFSMVHDRSLMVTLQYNDLLMVGLFEDTQKDVENYGKPMESHGFLFGCPTQKSLWFANRKGWSSVDLSIHYFVIILSCSTRLIRWTLGFLMLKVVDISN